MKTGGLEILWAEEKLTLLPERALWWARKKTLFMADPHFGKAAAFRFAGIAVPETSHDDDLDRLEKIVATQGAKKLVILGDFFHAKTGLTDTTLAAFKNWRDRHLDLGIILVAGNHDRHAGSPPKEWKLQCVEEPWSLAPFSCCHKPPKNSNAFALAGHVHPSFQLYERNGLSARGVCFYFKKTVAILPAFGSFTGTHTIHPINGEKVFLASDGQIIDVTRTFK